ncbi:MAG: M23 family metallopeptidase [Acidobacteria bacterium]|nr:M23 family metallopeptidase [Acidobacteriota bacterium]
MQMYYTRAHRLKRRSAFLSAFLSVILATHFAFSATVRPLKISHRARSLKPGEVVLMTVRSAMPLKEIEGKLLERAVPFFSSQDGRVWQGLIGIDLDVAPGTYGVELNGTRQDGVSVQAVRRLRVKRKWFSTRRLTVEEKFVTPPAEELERIRQESETVGSIFVKVSPERLWSGTFLRPVSGVATSSFGSRSILNGQLRNPHSGTDFRAREGTPVGAPNMGRVVLAADLYYSGNTVILDHGWGLYSYFAHLSRFAVSEGELISKGSLVGYVGATGRVTGPHLHWSMRLGGARVDPLSLVAALSGVGG